jgi:hypothetical protein
MIEPMLTTLGITLEDLVQGLLGQYGGNWSSAQRAVLVRWLRQAADARSEVYQRGEGLLLSAPDGAAVVPALWILDAAATVGTVAGGRLRRAEERAALEMLPCPDVVMAAILEIGADDLRWAVPILSRLVEAAVPFAATTSLPLETLADAIGWTFGPAGGDVQSCLSDRVFSLNRPASQETMFPGS